MNTQTESLGQISVEDLLRPFETAEDRNLKSLFNENMQLRDQVVMLEAEVDKQDKIIKLFAELLFLTCGDK
jgi:hypothetical protein